MRDPREMQLKQRAAVSPAVNKSPALVVVSPPGSQPEEFATFAGLQFLYSDAHKIVLLASIAFVTANCCKK